MILVRIQDSDFAKVLPIVVTFFQFHFAILICVMSLTVVIVFYIYFYKEKVENFCSQFSTPDVIPHSCHSIEDSSDNCSP